MIKNKFRSRFTGMRLLMLGMGALGCLWALDAQAPVLALPGLAFFVSGLLGTGCAAPGSTCLEDGCEPLSPTSDSESHVS